MKSTLGAYCMSIIFLTEIILTKSDCRIGGQQPLIRTSCVKGESLPT